MNARLVKIDFGCGCYYDKCSHDLKYHDKVLRTYYIKYGTTALLISLDGVTSYIYCEDCIDKIYKELKPILDKKLWVFK